MPHNLGDNIVPTERDLKNLNLDDGKVQDLIARAEHSDAEDRKLTIKQALKQYKVATFWAMFLSTSLIMEGFDLVTVRQELCSLEPELSLSSGQFSLRPNPISSTIWCGKPG